MAQASRSFWLYPCLSIICWCWGVFFFWQRGIGVVLFSWAGANRERILMALNSVQEKDMKNREPRVFVPMSSIDTKLLWWWQWGLGWVRWMWCGAPWGRKLARIAVKWQETLVSKNSSSIACDSSSNSKVGSILAKTNQRRKSSLKKKTAKSEQSAETQERVRIDSTFGLCNK